MAESGQILRTTVDDLNRVAQLISGNCVSDMRLELSQLNIQILNKQKRMEGLKAHEKVIKALIYNNAEQYQIAVAGENTQVDPLQSYRFSPIAPNPNQGIASAKFKIYSSAHRVVELESEINRINNDVMSLQAQIRSYKKSSAQLQAALDATAQNQSTSYQNTSVGKTSPPTPADIQKDKLVKARTFDLLYLQQLSSQYASYSTATTLSNLSSGVVGQRGYPDEVKLPGTMLNIRSKFWSVGQRFQDNTGASTQINFVQGPDALNFDDPGSGPNQAILNKWVGILRKVGQNVKITPDVEEFNNFNKSIATNSSVSEGIERSPDSALAASNSMAVQTQSYPATAMSLGPAYIGSYAVSTTYEMAKKAYKKKQMQFSSLPVCPNATPTPVTPTEQKEKNAQALNDNFIEAGQEAFSTALNKTIALQTKENLVPPLPDGAPSWAIQFNNMYGGSASTGQILYPVVAIGTPVYVVQIPVTVTKIKGSDSKYALSLASTPTFNGATTVLTPPKYQGPSYILGDYTYQLWSDTTFSSPPSSTSTESESTSTTEETGTTVPIGQNIPVT
jgi:hypothetical protein